MGKFEGVIAVEKSTNRKIGDVSTTYVSQESCPGSCPFKGSGCYAEGGMVGMHTRKLNKTSLDALTLAKEEAKAINSLSGKRNLRLHVVGDCKTNATAKIVSKAAKEYRDRIPGVDNRVWTYTHAYSSVDRSSWGSVSVLASTESIPMARKAMERGYAAAIVVPEFKDTKAWMDNDVRVIPCPEQTGKSEGCDKCKLCWDDNRLRETKSVIAFATHSQGMKKAQAALVQLGM